MNDFWELDFTKWWKIRCMQLDAFDYENGDLDKETFLKYMKIDISELQKVIENEEKTQETKDRNRQGNF